MYINNVFTNIISKKVHSDIFYETKLSIVIRDINPLKNTHLLFIPKDNYSNLDDLIEDYDSYLIVTKELHLFLKYMKSNFTIKGYSIRVNNNKEGGQEVPHLHFHILSDSLTR